ncbi:MAG: tail fiber domain-containing protein [Phycisphaerales bacterium]
MHARKRTSPLHGSLSTLLSLRPITYEYNDPTNPMYLPGTQTGFVAQEPQGPGSSGSDESPDGTLPSRPAVEAMVVDAMQESSNNSMLSRSTCSNENNELVLVWIAWNGPFLLNRSR